MGAIENLVGWVKESFFEQRRFVDADDLQMQLTEWLHEVNTTRPSRATGIIPAVRRAKEQPRLRPLRVTPAALALRIPSVVSAVAYVEHATHFYSMPSDAIGFPATLYLHQDAVRIVAGRFEAHHPRLTTAKAKSTLTACERGLDARVFGAEYITHYLEPTDHPQSPPPLELLA